MAVAVEPIKCPECGATLNIEDEGRIKFCPYCGSPLLLSNDNEVVLRNVDEAGIIRAKTDRIVVKKQMELEEKEAEKKEKRNHKLWSLLNIVLLIVGAAIGLPFVYGLILLPFSKEASEKAFSVSWLVFLIALIFAIYGFFFYIGFIRKGNGNRKRFQGGVAVPSVPGGFEGKDYMQIADVFKIAGFTNIKAVNMRDLWNSRKDRTVESITIDGEKIDCSGDYYMHDATVVIYYHGMKQ